MNIDKALQIAKDTIQSGTSVQLDPTVKDDKLSARVIVSVDGHLEKDHLEILIDQASYYDCRVVIKDNLIIFE